MKLDKETIIKHQFWFLLGGYALVWFIAVLTLWIAVPGKITELQKAYEKQESELKSASANPKNPRTFCPPWEQYSGEVNAHKYVIWSEVWDLQKGIYDWPSALGKDMSTVRTELTPEELAKFSHEMYPKQMKDLQSAAPQWLKPIEIAGGIESIVKQQDWPQIPTREEIWLAQEDYWVKRELLYVIYQAMVGQSLMYPVAIDEKKEPKPEGVEARYRYRNDNWELTLHLHKKDGLLVIGGDSTIKNVHPSMRPQPLMSAKGTGILFNVAQDQVVSSFMVRGEPVPYGKAQTLSSDKEKGEDYKPLDGIDWTKMKDHPISLSQGFDQTNCPIRRINALTLDKKDCRTHTYRLYPNEFLIALDAPPEDPNAPKKDETPPAANTGGLPEQMAGMQQQMQRMMKGGTGIGGGAATGNTVENPTPNNGLERNRYLQPPAKGPDGKWIEPPSRHLPFAMQLIVEQAHLQDILMALCNSRLRVQITQVDCQRTHDYVPAIETDTKDGTAGTGGFFMPRMGGGGMYGMQQQMQRMMGMKGGPMGGPTGGMMGSGGMRGGPMGGPTGGMMGGPGGGMRGGPMGGGMMGGPSSGMMMMQQQMMQRQMMGSSMMGGPMGPRGGTGSGGMKPSPINMLGGGSSPTLGGPRPPSGDSKVAPQNQPDENVVTVTVYGIATLYRLPDPPQTAQENQTPAPPGAPPSPTTPQATPTTPDARQPDQKTADGKKPDDKAAEAKKADDKSADKKQPEAAPKAEPKTDQPAAKSDAPAPPAKKETAKKENEKR